MFLRRTLPRLLLAVALLTAASAAGYYYWRQREAALQAAAAAAVRQEVISRGTLVSTVSASGYLAARRQANLYFTAGAPLTVVGLDVTLGDEVRAGQVLARLDSAELELGVAEAEQAVEAARLRLRLLQAPARPEDVAVAEANIRVAQNQVYAASLGATTQEVEVARLNLVLAQNALNQTYATMKRLEDQGRFAEKNALQRQADQQVEAAQVANLRYQAAQQPPRYGQAAVARASVEQAEAALARLLAGPSREDVEIAQLQISQAEAALEAARYNLASAVLVAPFDGVVAAVNLRLGEPASSALPAVILADVAHFYLDVLVDEVDVALVAPGQPVTVTLDALPDLALGAVVEKVAPAAEVTAGIVNYPVRLTLAAGEARLRGGLTASAAIIVGESRDVVLAPNWAIRRDRATGAAFVSLLRGGVVVEAPVTLGERGDEYSEVRSGVEAGEIAAVGGERASFSFFGE
jgi:HlyD family secretion protein